MGKLLFGAALQFFKQIPFWAILLPGALLAYCMGGSNLQKAALGGCWYVFVSMTSIVVNLLFGILNNLDTIAYIAEAQHKERTGETIPHKPFKSIF